MRPNISIIIPIYNMEKYLEKSIDSVLNQTIKNIEIILVNDGSVDRSGKIIDEYAKKDARIKVIHQKNRGVSVARNEGLALAKGEYVGFVDPDDWIELDMYEILYIKAIENDCDIVMCNYIKEVTENISLENYNLPFENNTLMEKDEIKDQICKQLLVAGFYTYVWDKIYRKSFLEENKINFFVDIQLREDYFFNIDIFNYSKKVVYISKMLYHYRDVPNSAVKKYYENAFENAVKLYEYKIKYSTTWELDTVEIRYKMACDFLNEVQSFVKHVFDYRNSYNFRNKVKRIYEIVNNCTVKKSLIDYKHDNLKNTFGKTKIFTIKLINKKSVILLSIMSIIISNIPKNLKKN